MVNQETISKLLQSASEFFKLQKYSEALAVYDSILSIDPINVEVFWRKGQTLSKLGKYEVALTWFDRALFSNSKNALIWNDKGIALFNLGNVSEAIDVFTQALAITPNDANILKNKDFALKKLDEQKQLKKSNDSIALNWHTKGIDYLKQEKYAEAITAFDEALKITPNDTILKNNKDLALKKRDAQNRLKDSNALALGLNNSGNGYFKQGKYAEAINEYNQALRLTPNNKTIKNNRDNAQKNLEKSKTKPFQIPSVVGYVILLIFISGAFGLIFQHSNLIQQTDQASSSNQQTIPTLVTPGDVHPGIILEPTSTIDATTDAMNSEAIATSKAIDYMNPSVKNFATALVKKINGGPYSNYGVNQISDVWDEIYSQWGYVSDPSTNYYTSASDTINNGLNGNCEDFAILNAAITESIGGTSRVITACSPNESICHAYAEVFITNNYLDLQSTTDYLGNRYGIKTIYYHEYTDPQGTTEYWLTLDWWANHPGGPFFHDDGTYKIFYPNGAYDVITNSGSTVITSQVSGQSAATTLLKASTTTSVTQQPVIIIPTSTPVKIIIPTPTPVKIYTV